MKSWIKNGMIQESFFEAARRAGETVTLDEEARIRELTQELAQGPILGSGMLSRLTMSQFLKYIRAYDQKLAMLPQNNSEKRRLAEQSWNESLGFFQWSKALAGWAAASEVSPSKNKFVGWMKNALLRKSKMSMTTAKKALDKVIDKARVHLYKPIQVAEILYRDRVEQNITLSELTTYRTQSKKWRDVICIQFPVCVI